MPPTSRSASIRLNVDADAARAGLDALEKRGDASLNAVGAAAERQTPRLAAFDRAINSALKEFDPLGVAVDRAAKAQELLNRAHANGRITAEQYARVTANIREQSDLAAAALTGTGNATRFSATQMSILQSGAVNTFQSIAAGLPIGQTLLTQATQTAPAFAGMGRSIFGVLAPLAALGAAGAVVVGRLSGINNEAKQVDEILKRLNPNLDASAAKLRSLSFNIADEKGIGRGEAMAGISALASIRDLSSGLLEPLARLVPDLARVLGKDLAEAARDVGTAFLNGSASLAEFGKETGLLTLEQQKQVKALDDQGKRAEAYALALKLLQDRVGGASAAMQNDFSRAATQMGRAWDNLVEKVAGTDWVKATAKFSGDVVSMSLKGWGEILTGFSSTRAQGIDQLPGLGQQIFELQRVRGGMSSGTQAAGIDTRIANLQAQVDKILTDAAASSRAAGAGTAAAATTAITPRMSESAQAYLDRETEAITRQSAARKVSEKHYEAEIAYQNKLTEARAAGVPLEQAQILAGKAKAEVLQKQALSQADANKAELEALAAHRLTLAGTEAVIAAYGVSAEAVVRAEAAKQAAVEANGKKTIDVAARTREILAQGAADAEVQVAAQLAQSKEQTAAAQALAAVAGQGAAAEREVTAAIEAERITSAALTKAHAEGRDARIANVFAMREQLKEQILLQKAAQDEASGKRSLQGQRDELILLQRQGELIGQRPELVARETAMLRERQKIMAGDNQYLKDNVDLYVRQAGDIAEMSNRMSEFQRVSQHTTDQIVDAVGSMWDPGRRSFASFKDLVLRGFREIIANSIIRPIIAPIVTSALGSIMGGGQAAAGGNNSALFAQASAMNPGAIAQLAAGGGGGGLGGLGGLLGGSGGGLGGLGGMLGGAGSTLGLIGTGVGIGMAGMGLGSMLGLGSGDQTKDMIFGTVGGALGSVFGPVGTFVGSFAGQALASLFKKKPSVGPNGFGYYTLGAGGADGFGLDWIGKDNGFNPQASVDQGADYASDFNKLIKGLGGTGFADATGGTLSYTVGKHPGVEGLAINVIRNGASVSGDPKGFDDTGAAGDYLFRQLLENGVVEGLSEQVNAVIRKSADIRENLDEVANDVAFAKALYETNPFDETKLTALEQSLKNLGAQFDEYKKKAEELGIATALVTDKYDEAVAKLKADFNKGIDDQLLSLRDPKAYALQQFEESFADIRKQAELSGADMVKVEQLYALQRAEVLKNVAGGVLDQLRDYGLSLRTGGLSPLAPEDQYAGLRATFEATAAQALAGDVTAQGKLQSASQAFLEASKAYNASSEAFAADWSRVTGIIDQITGGAPAGFTSLAASAQATNDNLAMMAVMQDESLGYTRDMRNDTRALLDEVRLLRGTVDRQARDIADMALRSRAS